MKKKLLLLGISSLLCAGVVAAGAIAFRNDSAAFKVSSTDDFTITINAEDITTSTELVSGSYVAYTDQLHNPVTFNYANIKFEQVGDEKYIVFGEDAWFGNDKDWQVRSISAVTVFGDDSAFSYDYGWDVESGSIVFTEEDHYDWAGGTDIYCNSDYPNYFKIMHRTSNTKISKIVFSYGSDCTGSSNPYVIQNGLKYKKHSGYAQVVGFAGASQANVVVADTVAGLPVTSIDHHAFYYDMTIESITLGANVTLINNDAFRYAWNLTEVNGLDHVTTIFNDAFEGCTGLSVDLVFGDDMSYIGNGAFAGSGITSISFDDDSDPYIGNGAFRRCEELTSVHYGASNTYYDDLLYCPKLETITVSAGNENIFAVENVLFATSYGTSYVERIAQNRAETSFTLPDDMFLTTYCAYGATTLETLVLNDDEYRVPDYAFDNCTSLTSITFGNHSDFVIGYSFSGCSALEELTIPSNVSTIYQCAFEDCENLKTVIFEEGCETLDNQVFLDCVKLEKVVLPSTLINVGNGTSWTGKPEDVFDGCTSLRKVLTRLEDGEDYSGDFATGWLGGRTLVKHSDTIKDASHWRLDATYGPQAWKTTITFKTNYGTNSGEGMFMFGTFNGWAKTTDLRMSYDAGVWSIDIELDTCTDTPYEFKCYKGSWDDPNSNNHFENNNHSEVFKDVDFEYWCTDFS